MLTEAGVARVDVVRIGEDRLPTGSDLVGTGGLYIAGGLTPLYARLLAGRGVKVAHCPTAGLKHTKGLAAHGRFPEMVDAGVCVSLGGDSGNGSNHFDMLLRYGAGGASAITGDYLFRDQVGVGLDSGIWVLDPFCGRGTTNYAARLLGRRGARLRPLGLSPRAGACLP